eukprot:scaffold1965_cov110-Cylindrotheca_fusiformis.AAC.9
MVVGIVFISHHPMIWVHAPFSSLATDDPVERIVYDITQLKSSQIHYKVYLWFSARLGRSMTNATK